ncbi:Xanthine permease [Candidatus Syntrophocurvum alkaliphilum]|uniref:Xanthine permease n=1 Tax=Candidatus Syntrophocurvum alkaliphilum TaxID=2293317 RepID=A0A6I6DIN1_9FIRM|nr:solute carrier family 23 protein [Candidatus Syntrophocurvum alkaliphilum]QGT99371.1 Xanthine permease [Candidatus Syntrophocurvum alkaliphilum]
MDFKYKLEDRPPIGELLLFGLQWLILAIPPLIIIGIVVASLHFTDISAQIIYMQKVFFVMSVLLLVQLFWGHRLPLITGPAGVLLIGIIATQAETMSTVYTSIFIGGFVLAFLAITGLFNFIKMLFTSRVIAVILLLIAFTLTPTIMDLIIDINSTVSPTINLIFALLFILVIFLISKYISGILKSTLVIWAIIFGSLLYTFIFPQYNYVIDFANLNLISWYITPVDFKFSINISVILAFLVSFLALSINDLGSIQSTGSIVQADNMDKRTTKGIFFTGVGNMLAGLYGVIGPVNFSLSPGIITATSCASRYTLIPAGLGLLLLSFSPLFIGLITNIPSVIIGSVLIYLMTSQVAAGLMMAFESQSENLFNNGLIIGLPLLIGIIVAYLPQDILATFPAYITPVIGNGFVMGVITVLIMEHIIFTKNVN